MLAYLGREQCRTPRPRRPGLRSVCRRTEVPGCRRCAPGTAPLRYSSQCTPSSQTTETTPRPLFTQPTTDHALALFIMTNSKKFLQKQVSKHGRCSLAQKRHSVHLTNTKGQIFFDISFKENMQEWTPDTAVVLGAVHVLCDMNFA